MVQHSIRTGMSVTEAVEQRRSVRGFLPTPVDRKLLESILATASRAPSGGNLQPWHATVLAGDRLGEFRAAMDDVAARGLGSEEPQYAIYPSPLPSPYADRRLKVGEDMYGLLGIERDDQAGRRKWFAENFRFFGAPVGLILHMPALMGPPQWSDLGMWMQTLMLLLVEAGLGSCPQESWSLFHGSVRKLVPIPEDHMIFAGMAIGYPDPDKPVNRLRAERAPLAETLSWLE